MNKIENTFIRMYKNYKKDKDLLTFSLQVLDYARCLRRFSYANYQTLIEVIRKTIK